MNTLSNGVTPLPAGNGGAPTRPMYWSVRRELWEHRAVSIAPLCVTVIVLIAVAITTIVLIAKTARVPEFDAARLQRAAMRLYHMPPGPIMLTTIIVGFFYSLDAHQGERRDRSILFWKSLPVSDLTTVLSKAAIPLAVLPLIGLALSAAVQIVTLVVTSMVLAAHGVSAGALWRQIGPSWLVLLYGVIAHVLWHAPIYGWLLLVSAWARRAPILWALLPLLAISAIERIAFNSSHFTSLLKYRFMGAMTEAFTVAVPGKTAIIQLSHLDPAGFLSAPGLWAGLAFTVGCLYVAVRLRRSREPL